MFIFFILCMTFVIYLIILRIVNPPFMDTPIKELFRRSENPLTRQRTAYDLFHPDAEFRKIAHKRLNWDLITNIEDELYGYHFHDRIGNLLEHPGKLVKTPYRRTPRGNHFCVEQGPDDVVCSICESVRRDNRDYKKRLILRGHKYWGDV